MHDKCLNCGASLDTAPRADNPGARAQMKWCSDACKRHYKNRAYYALHRDEVRSTRPRQSRIAIAVSAAWRPTGKFKTTNAAIRCARR